jgi:hypothetical protein
MAVNTVQIYRTFWSRRRNSEVELRVVYIFVRLVSGRLLVEGALDDCVTMLVAYFMTMGTYGQNNARKAHGRHQVLCWTLRII